MTDEVPERHWPRPSVEDGEEVCDFSIVLKYQLSKARTAQIVRAKDGRELLSFVRNAHNAAHYVLQHTSHGTYFEHRAATAYNLSAASACRTDVHVCFTVLHRK